MNWRSKQTTSRNGSMNPLVTEPPGVFNASNSSRTRCKTSNDQDKPTRDGTKRWPQNLPNNMRPKPNTNCEKTSYSSLTKPPWSQQHNLPNSLPKPKLPEPKSCL